MEDGTYTQPTSCHETAVIVRTTDPVYQFFAACFGEDWDLDASTPEESVDRFLAQPHTRHELQEISAGIQGFVAAHDDAVLPDAIFRELRCNYIPEADGHRTKDWLLRISETIGQAATRAPDP